jgi:hypothetical protein
MVFKFVLKFTCSLRSLLIQFMGQPSTLTLNNPNPNPNPFWTLLDWDLPTGSRTLRDWDLQGVRPCGTGTYRESDLAGLGPTGSRTLRDWDLQGVRPCGTGTYRESDLAGLGPTGSETQRVNPKIVLQLMKLTFWDKKFYTKGNNPFNRKKRMANHSLTSKHEYT